MLLNSNAQLSGRLLRRLMPPMQCCDRRSLLLLKHKDSHFLPASRTQPIPNPLSRPVRCAFLRRSVTSLVFSVLICRGDFRSIQIKGDSGHTAAAGDLDRWDNGGKKSWTCAQGCRPNVATSHQIDRGSGKSTHETRSRPRFRSDRSARCMRACVRRDGCA
jgi:hypothetical protein